MNFRISPLWWPVLGGTSPFLVPFMLLKYKSFLENKEKAVHLNKGRIEKITAIDIPEVSQLSLLPIVEEKTADGFKGDSGVSYLLKTEKGMVLFDIGFGSQNDVFTDNAKKMGIAFDSIDAVVISHLHLDHMGGMDAMKAREVRFPESIGSASGIPCFIPDASKVKDAESHLVLEPEFLPAGAVTTGPLARSLFFLGFTEEQSLVFNVRDKGLVIITGCGHPTIQKIVTLVKKLSPLPIYAICGGMHFPITNGRGNRVGIQFQRLVGTGKPPWLSLTDEDLTKTIAFINNVGPRKMLLSAHDSCDHSMERLNNEVHAETEILLAGREYYL